jgi:hypothetical protein
VVFNILRDEYRFVVSENKLLRAIFVSSRQEVRGAWEKIAL